MSTGLSPPAGSARETFLGHFGRKGPDSIAGSSIERAHQHSHEHGSLEGHFVLHVKFGFGRSGSMSTGSSPPAGSAHETFLSYFFRQNGPGFHCWFEH